jgi:hypothetical protein
LVTWFCSKEPGLVHPVFDFSHFFYFSRLKASWVSGRSLLHGLPPVNPGEAANMETKPDPHLDPFEIPSPSEKDHTPYSKLFINAYDWLLKNKGPLDYVIDPESDLIIYISFLTSETKWYTTRFRDSQKKAATFYRDPNTYWRTIAIGVCSLKAIGICKTLLPSLDTEKYLTKTNTLPASQKITPPATSTQIIKPLQKKLPLKTRKRQLPTVTEFILFYAPSKSCERTYSTTLSCCRNKRSSKGKKVYPYGQRYIAKLTRLSLATVERDWSWLRNRGIFNKARNENPKEHRCSLWYVCTSMKQVSYFRDLQKRHPKKRRQD